jgi:hypothetical protein
MTGIFYSVMESLFTFEASDDASNAVFVGALIMNDY